MLAAGQFSTWASAAVVGAAMLYQYPQLRRRLVRGCSRCWPWRCWSALPAGPRLVASSATAFGVPRSWLGRWDNLTNFYLPASATSAGCWGSSPNSVLQAPETWREVIYLEYGYLQFLWVGGVPLLLAFGWLSFAVLRHAAPMRDADRRRRCLRIGALGGAGGWCWCSRSSTSTCVLRGAGDLLFVRPGRRQWEGR